MPRKVITYRPDEIDYARIASHGPVLTQFVHQAVLGRLAMARFPGLLRDLEETAKELNRDVHDVVACLVEEFVCEYFESREADNCRALPAAG